MALTDVKVPDLGESKDVPIIEILVKVGDRVEKESALLVLESEKATMEVPAPEAGVVKAIKVKVGDKLNVGDVILSLESSSEAPTVAVEAKPAAAAPAAAQPPAAPKSSASASASASAPASAATAASVAAPAATSSVQRLDVRVPDIGDNQGIPVIEVLVKDGDAVEKDAPLAVLESEKATMELPAPQAGTVRDFRLTVGAKVSQGDAVCVLETRGAAPAAAAMQMDAPKTGAAKPASETATPANAPLPAPRASADAPGIPPWTAQAGKPIPHASPSIRKLAREFGVDISAVQGSGPKGRITQEDVQGYVKKSLATGAPAAHGAGIPPIPSVDFSQFGAIETKPLARIRRISAQYLHRAWLNIPHVTQHDDADITELEAFRKAQSEESGVKLTLLPFVMKAVAVALKQFPEINSSLAPDGESLVLKNYCHLGFAADTPNGLVVPVIRNAWDKGIVQLANECGELAKKARDGKLKPEEMKGGCFSISSLGGLGVTGGFTPIVNAPEVGILGVSRAVIKPVWDGTVFQPRLMCPLSLSYDHRVIDGAQAARFMVALTKLLADLRRTVL